MIYEAGCLLVKKYGFKRVNKNVYEGHLIEKQNSKIFFDYLIRINLNPIRKKQLPIVKELQDKIPNSLDYHKYVKSNTFCLGIGIYEKIIYSDMKSDFNIFIEKYIKGYLYSVIHKDIFGVWGSIELNHNEKIAKKEALEIILDISDIKKCNTEQLMNNFKDNLTLCFCGSQVKYLDCHAELHKEILNKVSIKEIKDEIISILSD